MKVKELIEKLSFLPADFDVMIPVGSRSYEEEDLNEVKVIFEENKVVIK